jgi:hypothetical protein
MQFVEFPFLIIQNSKIRAAINVYLAMKFGMEIDDKVSTNSG